MVSKKLGCTSKQPVLSELPTNGWIIFATGAYRLTSPRFIASITSFDSFNPHPVSSRKVLMASIILSSRTKREIFSLAASLSFNCVVEMVALPPTRPLRSTEAGRVALLCM